MSLRRYLGGAMVQASMTAALAAQAFVVPRVLGQVEYGRTLAAISLPILVQAALETILFARTIQWVPEARHAHLKRLWHDALVAGPVLAVAAVLLALPSFHAVSRAEWATFAAGAPALLVVWMATTVLVACAYARGRHATITRMYLCSAVILPASVFFLRGFGARAFLLGLMIDKCVGFLVASGDREVRATVREARAATAPPPALGVVRDDYLPVLTPRLTLLLLSPGLVAASAWLLAPDQLAGFKVSISFVTGVASLVPVSANVLQADWTGNRERLRREAWVVLAVAFLLGLVGALGLFALGDRLRGVVLHTADASLRRFDVVFLAVPFFVLIGPLSSLLIVLRRTGLLATAFTACAISTVGVAVLLDPAWGFVAGALAFAVTVGAGLPRAFARAPP